MPCLGVFSDRRNIQRLLSMKITTCTLGKRALFVVCLTLLEEGAGVRWAVRTHTIHACNSPSGEDLVYTMTIAFMYSTTAAVASADIVAAWRLLYQW